MIERYPHNPTPYDDDWEDQPGQGAWYKWGCGVLVPAAILAYGLHALITGHTVFGGRIPLILNGLNAHAVGVAAVSLALFLHCHYFWGNIYNQAWFAVLGKIIAACGIIGGMGTLIIRVGVLGLR